MTVTNEDRLGGRLPLADPQQLDPAQRELADYMRTDIVPWADAAGFRATTTDGRFIGPFNPALRSPGLAGKFLQFQATEERDTSLSERVRQVVILAVGAVWGAAYELYAHSAAARHCGIPDEAVRDLAAGTLPDTLGDDEKAAYRFTHRLSTGHRVDDATFAQAQETFGDRGIADMIVLAGTYHTVCGLLNAFDVPAPQIQHAPLT
jgi:4-carboxymuconolactone decarboxylase